MSILCERGYLGRRHSKSYYLQHKSARYYLTLKAVKLLSQPEYGLDKKVLTTRRYEDKKTRAFVDLQVAIFTAYLDIKASAKNPDALNVYTATEMAVHEDAEYIRPLPSLLTHNTKTRTSCFIDIFPDDQHLFIVKKRIRKYIEHFENGDWEGDAYPDIYLVRRSASDRKKLEEYVETKMEEGWVDEDLRIIVVEGAIACAYN